MKLKTIYAKINLGRHLAERLLKRASFRKSAGLEQFLEFYKEDRIVAFDREEKSLLIGMSRCISCGLCDSLCPLISRTSPDGFLGASALPHLVRSIPAFAGLVPLDQKRCQECRGCESVCPEQVPLQKIISFIDKNQKTDPDA